MKLTINRGQRLALHGRGGCRQRFCLQLNPGNINVDIVIGFIAAVSAVITALFSMDIRQETPR